jgi:hypothetical protein
MPVAAALAAATAAALVAVLAAAPIAPAGPAAVRFRPATTDVDPEDDLAPSIIAAVLAAA